MALEFPGHKGSLEGEMTSEHSGRLAERGLPLLLVAASVPALAQQTPVVSPEVDPDRRVTFRFRAPNAKDVSLAREGAARLAMQKDEQGLWSVTTDPLEPDLYGYAFVADGVGLLDPSNPLAKPNLLHAQSIVHVRGPETLAWEVNDVPHGTLHRHFFRSSIAGDDRDFFVYTPPGWDPQKPYPTLYLLHGFSDDASAWTAVGRAHVILDNLIARGRARPMLVVMPLGYGTLLILSRTSLSSDPELQRLNFDNFRDCLLQEVIPRVEKVYRVSKNRGSRAVAGLSMGGSEALLTGLNALGTFSWVGAFSSGGLRQDFDAQFPKLDVKANKELRLLWIACGTDDRLIGVNRRFRAWLKARQIRHDAVETPGGHTWMVWRRNLETFASLVFQGP